MFEHLLKQDVGFILFGYKKLFLSQLDVKHLKQSCVIEL